MQNHEYQKLCEDLYQNFNALKIAIKLRNNTALCDWLQQQTAAWPAQKPSHRLYMIVNGEPPVCSAGNHRKFRSYEHGYWPGCTNKKCSCHRDNRVNQHRETMLQRYGVANVANIEGMQQRIRSTMQQRYGVNAGSQTAAAKEKQRLNNLNRCAAEKQRIRQKIKETSKKRYGVEHHMQLPQQQELVQNTNLVRRGVRFPTQDPAVRDAIKNNWLNKTEDDCAQIAKNMRTTMQRRYSVDYASQVQLDEHAKLLLDGDQYIAFATGRTHEQVMSELGICYRTLYLYTKKYNCSAVYAVPKISKLELEIYEFVNQFCGNVQQNQRNILNDGRELDIFVPDHKLAIEACGLYWHAESSSQRDKQYHRRKTEQCEALGIRLITIFEDQWYNQQTQMKNLIQHALGKSSRSISARQCDVVEIDSAKSKKFVDQHHMQGSVHAKVNLALIHNNEIHAVMTFGKSRYNSQYHWELMRFCTQSSVPGAASKLFRWFVKNHKPHSVISYADRCYSTGEVYQKLGFVEQKTTVGYWYTDYKSRFNRWGFQKKQLLKKLPGNEHLSEWQLAQQLGYDRIWDCGQTAWVHKP